MRRGGEGGVGTCAAPLQVGMGVPLPFFVFLFQVASAGATPYSSSSSSHFGLLMLLLKKSVRRRRCLRGRVLRMGARFDNEMLLWDFDASLTLSNVFIFRPL